MGADIHLVDTLEDATKFIEWARTTQSGHIAVDTETSGVDYRSFIRTIQFGDSASGWVIPYTKDGWGGLAKEARDIFVKSGRKIVMHNFTFDQKMLAKEGLDFPDASVWDTRIMAHLIDPTRPTGLKPLADRYVRGSSSQGQGKLADAMRKNKWTWESVPWRLPEYWFYGGLDTVITSRLFEELWSLTFPQFQQIYDLEHACQVVLRRVEDKGVRVDMDYVHRMSEELAEKAQAIRKQAFEEFGVVNLTSADQVSRKLIADGWEPTQFTNGGQVSMTKDVLTPLSSKYPLAALTLKCKHLEKMCSTQYLGGYPDLVDENGFVHPSINPIGARTGRMTVKVPALQTLHRDAMVRDAFIPRDGNKLIFVDYDQMEVRLTASFAGDPNYIEIIRTSDDVHRTTASQVYGIPESEVSKDQRQKVKNVIYAKLYGAGIPKFSETAGISYDEGERFMRQFDRAFPAVQKFIQHITGESLAGRRISPGMVENRYYEEGLAYVKSPYGRRHILNDREITPYTDSLGINWLGGPLYRLVNYLVQGTGADVLKQAVVDADRAGLSQYLVLLVHDEMGWDVPAEDVEDVKHAIKEVMEVHDRFPVPLTVGVEVCDRWGDKYAHTREDPVVVDHGLFPDTED